MQMIMENQDKEKLCQLIDGDELAMNISKKIVSSKEDDIVEQTEKMIKQRNIYENLNKLGNLLVLTLWLGWFCIKSIFRMLNGNKIDFAYITDSIIILLGCISVLNTLYGLYVWHTNKKMSLKNKENKTHLEISLNEIDYLNDLLRSEKTIYESYPIIRNIGRRVYYYKDDQLMMEGCLRPVSKAKEVIYITSYQLKEVISWDGIVLYKLVRSISDPEVK